MGHFGSASMVKHLKNLGIYWPTMLQDAIAMVSSCIKCQEYNIGKTGFHPLQSIQADLPLDHIAVDLKEFPLSIKGNKYMLVVVDVFTRFVILRALPDKKQATVAKELIDIFLLIGFPKILQTDNGKEFYNRLLSEICTLTSMDSRLITAYHPQGNGLAERWVLTTSQIIYKSLEGKDKHWDTFLGTAQYFSNLKVTKRHQSTPYSLLFCRSPNLLRDYQNVESVS